MILAKKLDLVIDAFISSLILLLVLFFLAIALNGNEISKIKVAALDVEMFFQQSDAGSHSIQTNQLSKEKSIIKQKSTKAENISHEPLNESENKEQSQINSTSEKKSSSKQKLIPTYNPLPSIPNNLRSEELQEQVVARLRINKNGLVESVKLQKPSKDFEVNQATIKTLKSWKFRFEGFEAVPDFIDHEVTIEIKVE